mgnify:CR=1 FL=1
MSVLFAISKITTLKRDEDYPLIFDAPTSSFGEFKEDIFYNIIDNIDKQCVIFTKDLLRYDRDTEKRELDFDKINQLSCSVSDNPYSRVRWYIRFDRPFHISFQPWDCSCPLHPGNQNRHRNRSRSYISLSQSRDKGYV